jgi:hypothetical protein
MGLDMIFQQWRRDHPKDIKYEHKFWKARKTKRRVKKTLGRL